MPNPIRSLRALALGALALLSLALLGCSGGSGTGGTMFLESCSLFCENGANSSQVDCNTDTIRQNQEIALLFSQPVDIATVGPTTFQVFNAVSGATPGGSYLVDPVNPRRLVFRPSMTVNPQGQLEFGFQQGQTYRIFVPGADLDTGPYIQSVGGSPNKNRIRCDVQPSGIVDVVPGPPQVQVFVDQQLFDGSGNPAGILPNVDADGAVDVSQSSNIRLVFDDVMNPLSLITAGTQDSPTVRVIVDRDGSLSTTSDQTPLAGSFSIFIDQATSRTNLTFRPVCIPSTGIDGRKIAIQFLPGISDLVGLPLANPETILFTPELSDATEVILPEPFGELFLDRARLDAEASGKEMWSPELQPGRLVPGWGGGSGRHGRLEVSASAILAIDTDTQVYPASVFPFPGVEHNQITNEVPGVDYDPLQRSQWPLLPVADGIFEFSSIRVAPAGLLRIEGANHARLFSRGPVVVSGSVDISGGTPPAHNTAEILSEGGRGGPGAGDGGPGGTRYNAPASLRPAGGLNPGPSGIALPGGVTQALDGSAGGQVGNGVTGGGVPPPVDTPGRGGVHFPAVFPSGANQFQGLVLDEDSCTSTQVGGPGSGAGYALDGTAGIPRIPVGAEPSSLPPQTPAGEATPIEPADPESGHFVRRLNAELGFLRGGGGGGGGGTHLFGSGNNSIPGLCAFAPIGIFYDNSGAPGGGGGGALQLASGSDLFLTGQILARGGDGASAITLPPADTGNFDRRNAAPGGGGAGGAVRLQGISVQISNQPGRIDVRGGNGGLGVAASTGGDGSRGLVRLESTDTTFPLSRDSEAPKLLPFDPDAPTNSYEHLSVSNWTIPRRRPEAFSGASSCWIKALPQGGCFLQLDFAEDVPASTDPDDMGWNMDVIYDNGGGEQLFPYRGIPDDPSFPLLQSIQDALGNHLAESAADPLGSRFVVRFQGAQSRDDSLSNPCNVVLTGVNADVVANSVTPWVSHPAELNQFVPAPNMVRFVVIFDGTLSIPNTLGGFVKGVTNLRIDAIPD